MIDNKNLELEKLIGKSLEETAKLGETIKTPDNYFVFKSNPISDFFDRPCGNLFISVNAKKIIESISVLFPAILDKSFYSEFIKTYGYPNSILANDKLTSESKSMDIDKKGFTQNLVKRVYSMKEVAFDDKPFYILWSKENYQIKMTFYYQHNGTEVIFRKLTNTF